MNNENDQKFVNLISNNKDEILEDWLEKQKGCDALRVELINEEELEDLSGEFMDIFVSAIQLGNLKNIKTDSWSKTRDFLDRTSTRQAKLGFDLSETAMFIFSLKQSIFKYIQEEYGTDFPVVEELHRITHTLLDKLGLYTTGIYQKNWKEMIARLQEEVQELSTPVIEIWEGVLVVPIIGTLDSSRTQTMTENLLNTIINTDSDIAIIDITGVAIIDTQTAQHLLRAVSAARLMGAECIISGITPKIAQTIVSLGLTFDVITKRTLADAFDIALEKIGLDVLDE